MPPGKKRKVIRDGAQASPGPKHIFFATPASRITNAEPKRLVYRHARVRPKGMSHLEFEDSLTVARRDAKIITRILKGRMQTEIDPRAETALEELNQIVVMKRKVEGSDGEEVEIPAYPAKDRISAAKTVLDFTKEKPKQVTETRDLTAEEWLEQLAQAEEDPAD